MSGGGFGLLMCQCICCVNPDSEPNQAKRPKAGGGDRFVKEFPTDEELDRGSEELENTEGGKPDGPRRVAEK